MSLLAELCPCTFALTHGEIQSGAAGCRVGALQRAQRWFGSGMQAGV